MNRLTASSWLLAAGDTAQAARLLTWEQGIYWYSQHRLLTTVNKTVAPVALFERAQIEASLGQAVPAAALYREFVHRYDMAQGEWARRVEQALAQAPIATRRTYAQASAASAVMNPCPLRSLPQLGIATGGSGVRFGEYGLACCPK